MTSREKSIQKFNKVQFHDRTLNNIQIKQLKNKDKNNRKVNYQIKLDLELPTDDYKNAYNTVLEFVNPVNIEMDCICQLKIGPLF